jgi:hypothetical protein
VRPRRRLRPRHLGSGAASLLCAAFLSASRSSADEPKMIDQEALNQRIGLDYENEVTYDALIDAALGTRLILFGEVHDQLSAPRQFQRLVRELRQRSRVPLCIGVEFVDREDTDILSAYLKGKLDEDGFLERLYPTSLLLSRQGGRPHLEILRFAREAGIPVVALETRPAGSRPRPLRHGEIRWNLSHQIGRHPEERLVVLYGVDHILGEDPIAAGVDVPTLVITSYGDSVQAAFKRREGRYPRPGEVLRIRPGVYLQAGDAPRERRLLRVDLDAHEVLLDAIESVYFGGRNGIDLLVGALGDAEIRWRRAAFLALRFAISEDFGYDPEADVESRRAAVGKWQAWWTQTGSKLSAAAP